MTQRCAFEVASQTMYVPKHILHHGLCFCRSDIKITIVADSVRSREMPTEVSIYHANPSLCKRCKEFNVKQNPGLLIVVMIAIIGVFAAALIVLTGDDDAQDAAVAAEASAEQQDVAAEQSEPVVNDDTTLLGHVDVTNLPVPALPFDDNPDPNECGIPQAWGPNNNAAWLSGVYEGELHQPIVYLYDSHGRSNIVTAAPHGTQVEIVMFQSNPTLNYYYVRIPDAPEGMRLGWVPAFFLSLEPLSPQEAA